MGANQREIAYFVDLFFVAVMFAYLCANPSPSLSLHTDILDIPAYERRQRIDAQRSDNKWHQFVDDEVILKQGFVNKRKGLFARKRMLLLTTGPRLVYVDPVQMVKKGEIPFSRDVRVEPKNFKIFFVHTVSGIMVNYVWGGAVPCASPSSLSTSSTLALTFVGAARAANTRRVHVRACVLLFIVCALVCSHCAGNRLCVSD